jgi:hypothetical protein
MQKVAPIFNRGNPKRLFPKILSVVHGTRPRIYYLWLAGFPGGVPPLSITPRAIFLR